MTANQAIRGAQQAAMLECITEDNTCYRIEAGSACAGSDVAANLMRKDLAPYCLCCGHTRIEHTEGEWELCQVDLDAWFNREVR